MAIKISITEQNKQDCREFAEIYADTVGDIYAKDRNQTDIEIIINQAYWAKLAEVAVEREIGRIGVKITEEVDFSIHQRHQKSFDADIKTVNARLHVKSVHCDRAEKSWVFQKTDPVVYEPEEDEILVFCVTYLNYVEIVGACLASDALSFYASPRKDELSATKECLYLNNHPKKRAVPEISQIVKSLETVLKAKRENRVGYNDKSRKSMRDFAWKEF
ncbi:hypothetical protein [Brunnivagina elsteri]|uniref:Uncharacterized protein n=1 Tax=Brunnivagina elsteri CCALA 953 TaxID=987040 RepID=A0A2A2TPX2_9CYAN|nr:hypothetical protein [Calothrix elsteri]PAX60198.1 hypothetical protein CK510_02960 [Calothrix elsteri CCALA 953]